MNKIIVIGCPGSGKSTFARRLNNITGIPLYCLDTIWHKPDKTNVSKKEFDEELKRILSLDCWIIDGNYLRTLEMRLKECDTVFLFDIPIADCLDGVSKRIGKSREDMPWIEESFDEEFHQYILNFPSAQLPEIHVIMGKYTDMNPVVFHSRAESDAFLNSL